MARSAGPSVADIIESAVLREPLTDPVAPGYSGAVLERLQLADGSTVILKSSTPANDLAMAATADPGRAFLFALDGVYDRLPASIDPTVIAVDRDEAAWRMVMADVAGHLVPEGQRISRDDSRRVLAAMRDLHSAFVDSLPGELCPLETHLALFSTASMEPFMGGANPLPSYAVEAWPRFDEAAPPRVREAVQSIHTAPAHLAADLTQHERTMTHADLSLANLGLADGRVIMLDFAMACEAPGDFDFAIYLIQNDWLIEATNDEIVSDWAELAGRTADDRTVRLALLAAFAEYACWKAPDPSDPSDYSATFDWWVERTERTLVADGGHFGW